MQFKELTFLTHPIYYYLRTETLEHDIISCFFMHILVYSQLHLQEQDWAPVLKVG